MNEFCVRYAISISFHLFVIDSSTLGFFCGGDVWGMDWCPLPGKTEQY